VSDSIIDPSPRPLATWIPQVVDEIRRRTNGGDSVPGSFDCSAPLHVQVIDISEPRAQLIVLIRGNGVTEGTVDIFGPATAPHVVTLLERALANPVWDLPAYPIPGNVQRGVTGGLTRRDAMLPLFAGMVGAIRATTIVPFERPRLVERITILDSLGVNLVIGGVNDVPPQEFVNNLLSESVRRAERAEPEDRVGGTAGTGANSTKVYLTSFEPDTWVGRIPERRTLLDFVNGVVIDSVSSPALDVEGGGRRVVMFRNGLIAATATDSVEATIFFNDLFAILSLEGHQANPVNADGVATASIEPNGSLGSFEGIPRVTGLLSRTAVFSGDRDAKSIGADRVRRIVPPACEASLNPGLSTKLRLWAEASQHLREGEFPQALVLGWVVIEREISDLWNSYVTSVAGISQTRIDTLTEGSEWTASRKIEILQHRGDLSLVDFERITRVRKLRNKFAHSGVRPTEADAREAVTISEEIVRNHSRAFEL
jgi:hypothetical protein